MHGNLLEVSGLRVEFHTRTGNVQAVRDVSFELSNGEVFALVGESGCGKSTTALSIIRLVPVPGRITGGSILFEGKNLLSLAESTMMQYRGKEIGMIFQNPLVALNPVYRTGFQVQEAVMLDNVTRAEAWCAAIRVLKNVKLPDTEERAKSFPHELSGGMRQRAMIGMMISRFPKLLIADEPTTALDVTIQAQILELLMELRRQNNMSVLIITHDLGIVADIADRVGVMYAGSLVEQGDVFEIFENPFHPYTRLLLKALPRGTKEEGRLETISGSVPNLSNLPGGCPFHPRCPYRLDVCAVKEPEVVEVGPGHRVRCHLMGE